MSKLLGYVNYNDNDKLNEIAKENDIYLDNDAVWQEAQDYYDQTTNTEAEIRIMGADYIIVSKKEEK